MRLQLRQKKRHINAPLRPGRSPSGRPCPARSPPTSAQAIKHTKKRHLDPSARTRDRHKQTANALWSEEGDLRSNRECRWPWESCALLNRTTTTTMSRQQQQHNKHAQSRPVARSWKHKLPTMQFEQDAAEQKFRRPRASTIRDR